MPKSTWLGILIVLAGGAMTGSFTLPMKFIKRWEWENIWLVYSVVGLLLLPWIAASLTCPALLEALGATPLRTLFLTALFGLGWGVANVLFGVSVALIGMALTFAIVSGMSAAFGSLFPLILLTPERLGSSGANMILLGVALTVVGVAALGAAGRLREKTGGHAGFPQSMSTGLVFCIISGLLAPMLNFSFVFGAPIASNAARQGATQGNASHAIWVIGLFGGFLTNSGYAAIRLGRSHTWLRYANGRIEWALSPLTGILFTLGFLLYGRGTTVLGDLGPAVGWPAFQATTILVATTAGALSGEWRDDTGRILAFTCSGLVLLVSAIVVLSMGNRM